jgi:hypothetical protein
MRCWQHALTCPTLAQGIDVGVALPEFFFTKDSKSAPLMLLALVGGGILLPLSIVSWYILSSKKYTGPNGIMNETMYFYMHPLVGIKESQVGAGRGDVAGRVMWVDRVGVRVGCGDVVCVDVQVGMAGGGCGWGVDVGVWLALHGSKACVCFFRAVAQVHRVQGCRSMAGEQPCRVRCV